MRKNVAGQIVSFQMNATANGAVVTTGTPAVYFTVDGGSQGTGAGTSTHEGNGQWSYAPAQAETNGNHVAFTMILANAIAQTVNTWPVSFDPTNAATMGTTLATAANLATVDTVVDGIRVVTDNLPEAGALTTISADTARLTAARAAVLTDWADGGRLDTLLDAIPTTPMRGTDGANTVVPDAAGTAPTAAEIRSEMDSNSTKLVFMDKSIRNKLKYDKATDNMILYDNDGVTPLLTFAMVDDINEATRGAGS